MIHWVWASNLSTPFAIIKRNKRIREVLYLKEHSIDIQLSHPDDLFHLWFNERHLRLMEEELDVVIHARTEIVQVLGEETACEEARQVIQALMVLVNRGMTVGTPDVVTAITMVKNDEIDKFVALYEEEIIKDNTGKPIRVKTLGPKTLCGQC